MKTELYDKNWRDVIRPSILARDGYKCQHCGIMHKSYAISQIGKPYIAVNANELDFYRSGGFKVVVVSLNIAHLNQIKSDNEPGNLLSLCSKCHVKYDRRYRNKLKVKYNAKVKESSVDFKAPEVELSKADLLTIKQYLKYEYSIVIGLEDVRQVSKLIINLFVNSNLKKL